jgi:rhodanese-related sulfurtransferase
MNPTSQTPVPFNTRVRQVVEAGATVLDVRTVEEFAGGHVRGALNIPLHVLPLRMSELGPKDRPLVLYCLSGGRSGQAAEFLRRAGFAEVLDVGPMSAFPR